MKLLHHPHPKRFSPGQRVVFSPQNEFIGLHTGLIHPLDTPPPGIPATGTIVTVEFYAHFNTEENEWFLVMAEYPKYAHNEQSFKPLSEIQEIMERYEHGVQDTDEYLRLMKTNPKLNPL